MNYNVLLESSLSTIPIDVTGKGQKSRKMYSSTMSLSLYFVPLSASAKKEIIRPTRQKLLEHSVSPRFICSSGALSR